MASKGREVANLVSAKTGIAVTISGDPVVVGIANTELLRVLANGTIGIGTTLSGAQKVKISGGGLAFDDGSLVQWGINDVSSIKAYSGQGTAGHMAFAVNTEHIRLKSDGKLGIGTIAPASAVDISGTAAEVRFYRDARDRFGSIQYTGSKFQIKQPASDHLTIVDGSDTELIRVSSTGLVGIGTDNPLGMIHVLANDSTTYNAASDSAAQQYGGATLSLVNVNPTSDNYCSINFLTRQTSSGGSRIVALNSGNNESTLTFCTESSGTPGERMRIANNGRVGIGNTSPTTTLHIGYDNNPLISIANGASIETSQSGIRWLFGSGNSEYAKIIGVSTASGGAELRFVTSNGGTQKTVTIDSAGRLGVGVSWPSHTVHVYENMMIQYPGTPYIAFSEDSVERSLDSFVLGYDGINYGDDGNHMFFANGAWTPHASGLNEKRLIITQLGEIGINTICAAGFGLGFELDIYDKNNSGAHIALNRKAGGTYGDSDIGYISFYNAASQTGGKGQIGRIFCEAESSGAHGSFEFHTRYNSNSRMHTRLNNVGYQVVPGAYTYTQAGSTLTVDSSGNIRRTSSSIKYKRDVEDLDYSIVDNAITNLQPRWYRTKNADGDDKLTWSHVGLIAEEVHLVEPRLVRYRTVGIGTTIKPAKYNDAGVELEPEKVKNYNYDLETPEPEDIDYARLAVINLAEIKVLRARIAELESRVGIAST